MLQNTIIGSEIFILMIKSFWISELIFQATLGFFTLASEPVEVVNPLIDNLITLLCTILLTRYLIFKVHMFLLIFYLLNKPSHCAWYKGNHASAYKFWIWYTQICSHFYCEVFVMYSIIFIIFLIKKQNFIDWWKRGNEIQSSIDYKQ